MTDLRTFVLMAGMTALFLVSGQLLGGHNGMVMALILAVGLNFWAYWSSDTLVLRMHNAFEVGPREAPEYYAVVQELARRANLPMPRVYIMDDPSPNAFATGRDPEHAAVAATTGLLRILNREELAGVMGHELGHVQNHDILISTITATLAGAITTLANMAQWGAIFGMGRSNEEGGNSGGIGGFIMMLLAPLAAMLIQMAISRSREYGADQRGAELCGNPLWLANALNKLEAGSQRLPMGTAQANPASSHLFIVNPLSGNFLAGLFSTHPPMEDRIHRLQQMARRR
ncbi:MAG: zinc metalloprotease HtpX [Magnetococcales bacterium]|nr:zinc metalloprotease HtpX [Magnetococcales bacterium]MBF0421237.1 zinc metalloprotease HtpX [Magnetococcales bacterium]MBF0434338.1 zinc metalloprotease HtpX [Magnetococcales bacterium]